MRRRGIVLAALMVLLLSCQLGEMAEKITPTVVPETHLPIVPSPALQITETPLELLASPSPGTTIGSSLPQESPEEVAKKYYEALVSREFEEAVNCLSDYSLSLSGTTRQEVISFFEQQDFKGWRMVDYRLVETRVLSDDLVLAHILTKEQLGDSEPQVYDFWVALRREGERWRLNGNLIVDDVVLNVEPQTINGVSVQPVQIVRYTDRLVLILQIENKNDRGCFWGWGNKVAVFHFGGEVVDVTGSLQIEANRTYTNVRVHVSGFHSTYPSAVDLVGWCWASQYVSSLPDPACTPWEYHFVLTQ